MSEWKKYKLSEIIELIGGGTPKTSVSDYWNGDIPWLSVADFGKSTKYVYKTEKTITKKGLMESSTKILKKGQIIISARGTVGELAILGKDMAFNQSCYGITSNEKTVNDFLYYLLKFGIEKIKKNTHGAVFDTITRQTFENIQVEIPNDLNEQIAIASVLSSLDDKIEININMNKTLEAIGYTIFKEWFINFNFPGFDGNLINDLPKGWKKGKISDFGRIVCGKTPSKAVEEYFGGENMFIKIPDMHNSIFVIETSDTLTDLGVASQQNKTLPPFSVCVSSIATVGLVSINPTSCQTNQQINSIIPGTNFLKYYLFFKAKSMKETFVATASGGTATLNMNTTQFSNLECAYPKDDLLIKFDEVITPIMLKILANEYQNKSLMKIRDLILPQLMLRKIQLQK